jgi:predicted transcriptional regulator
MTIQDICRILDAKVVSGNEFADKEVMKGFASDLMSDVLTLDTDDMLLITGLTNMQTLRTAEMADISCILFVRNKKVTDEMKEIAEDNDVVLLECRYSMFRTIGMLYEAGLEPVY